MADKIVLHKLGVAFAPAQKIASVKRENRDPDKRRFERQLTEENAQDQEDTADFGGNREDVAGEMISPIDAASLGKEEENRGPDNEGKTDVSSQPGSVVDIHV